MEKKRCDRKENLRISHLKRKLKFWTGIVCELVLMAKQSISAVSNKMPAIVEFLTLVTSGHRQMLSWLLARHLKRYFRVLSHSYKNTTLAPRDNLINRLYEICFSLWILNRNSCMYLRNHSPTGPSELRFGVLKLKMLRSPFYF